MNRVNLVGRITKAPEMQGAEGKEVCRFNLAVNRPLAKEGQQQADFVPCVAFRQSAVFLSKYIGKGNLLSVEGRIATGQYQGQDGKTVYTTEVVVERVENLTPKGNGEAPKAEKAEAPKTEAPQSVVVDVADDDLPF